MKIIDKLEKVFTSNLFVFGLITLGIFISEGIRELEWIVIAGIILLSQAIAKVGKEIVGQLSALRVQVDLFRDEMRKKS